MKHSDWQTVAGQPSTRPAEQSGNAGVRIPGWRALQVTTVPHRSAIKPVASLRWFCAVLGAALGAALSCYVPNHRAPVGLTTELPPNPPPPGRGLLLLLLLPPPAPPRPNPSHGAYETATCPKRTTVHLTTGTGHLDHMAVCLGVANAKTIRAETFNGEGWADWHGYSSRSSTQDKRQDRTRQDTLQHQQRLCVMVRCGLAWSKLHSLSDRRSVHCSTV